MRNRISEFLDKISFNNKMVLVYLLCVLLPIIFINLTFYSVLVERIKEYNLNSISAQMDRVSQKFLGTLENYLGIANSIYSDSTLNDVVDRVYLRDIYYVDEFNRYLREYFAKYETLSPQLVRFTLYTKNQTILEGGSIKKITPVVQKSDWYQAITTTHSSFIVRDNNDPVFNQKALTIIRKLDYFHTSNVFLKLLRIDIDLEFFDEIVSNELNHGQVFLINPQEKIVYSNSGQNTLPARESGKNQLVKRREMQEIGYLQGWKIVGFFQEKRLFTDLANLANYFLTIALISLLIASFLIFIITQSFNKRLNTLTNHMAKVSQEEFALIEQKQGSDEVGLLIKEFNQMTRKIKRLIRDVYQAEIQQKNLEVEQKQARLNALGKQINPHFLFNALNTIRMKSLIKKESETADIINSLAQILRRVLNWEGDQITIRRELEFVQLFLKIQKYRFEHRLEYEITVDDQLLDFTIPKMSLQVFVENACVHGIEEKEGLGKIRVVLKLLDEKINIEISDNGVGIAEDKYREIMNSINQQRYEHKHIGIINVIKRLQLYYEDDFEFLIDSKAGIGTTVIVKIPILRDV
ncbi:MAG: sensor histidine kinase [Halanaerobiales bacterium]|nr:sensor histidine kinase [Halanaerobiales bacterium]